MRIALLFLFSITLGLTACENEGAAQHNQPDPAEEKQEQPAAQLSERMQSVVKGIWWYEGYTSSRDEVRKQQRGKWFEFNPNGTFEYGKFQEKTGEGTWTYDESSETLYLKTPDGSETREWGTIMSKTNDIMIWLGPPTGPNAGDQAKLVQYLQRPTDADLAQ